MSISLPQTTTERIFYVINMVTFLLYGISAYYHQERDGASNELVVAMLYEYKNKPSKRNQKFITPFRWTRRFAFLALIAAIAVTIRKPTWILMIIETGMIIQTLVIFINCLTRADHNFTRYEQYWIIIVAAFLVLQRFPLGLFSNEIVVWQSQLPDGAGVVVQSVLWFVQIFMFFTAGLLAYNGFCKKKKKVKRIDYSHFSWNISDWYVKSVDKHKFLKYLLPLILIIDAVFYLIKKAVVFFAAMFNELLPSINDAIQRQVDTLDTQLIRLAFRGAIVCSLSMMYAYMELKGIHAESTRNIFSYVATVIVIPIVIEGILGLRERIKGQTKAEERKDKLEDILKEVVQIEAEKEAKREGDSNG